MHSTKEPRTSYDSRCYDLAEIFLSDEPTLNVPRHFHELAQDIQIAIEDYIAEHRSDKGQSNNGEA